MLRCGVAAEDSIVSEIGRPLLKYSDLFSKVLLDFGFMADSINVTAWVSTSGCSGSLDTAFVREKLLVADFAASE